MLNQLLFSSLILSFLQVVLLEIDNLLSSSELLLLFRSLDHLFLGKGIVKHLSIPFFLELGLLTSELLLSLVMSDKFKVPLTVKDELLSL
jgi:hypothetical protein